MSIGLIRKTGTYFKTGAMALLLSAASCTEKAPVITKDIVEFTYPTAAKLIENFENGARHSVTVFVKDSAPQIVKKDSMLKYKLVPDTLLAKLKTLPDTIELYYQVYKGKADKLIQSKLKNKDNLLTVGHGTTGRDYIQLADGSRAFEGDFILQKTADSIFNVTLNRKDSILKANIDSTSYDSLKKNEKDAVLSYLYNVSEKLLSKTDSKRDIPESFFECLSKGEKAKVQSKFNVVPSHEAAACGLAKRNLVQFLVYGDGAVLDEKYARKTANKLLDVFKNRSDSCKLLKEIFDMAEAYGVDSTKLTKTKAEFFEYLAK